MNWCEEDDFAAPWKMDLTSADSSGENLQGTPPESHIDQQYGNISGYKFGGNPHPTIQRGIRVYPRTINESPTTII